MRFTLCASQRIARLALSVAVFAGVGHVQWAEAHCGMEGCPAAAGAMLNASTQKTQLTAGVTNSLWGNMLLNMAYQRDTELQHLLHQAGWANVLTLTSVAGISGLGLAQGIDTLATLQQDPHPKHPTIIGIIGTGLSLGSLGATVALNHHFSHLIANRQTVIKDQVQGILTQLKAGESIEKVQAPLTTLIGEEATQEFFGLWQATHSTSKTALN